MALRTFKPEHAPEITPELLLKAALVLDTLRRFYRSKDKCVSSKSIEEGTLQLSGPEVRSIIRYLRRSGHPIGSNVVAIIGVRRKKSFSELSLTSSSAGIP